LPKASIEPFFIRPTDGFAFESSIRPCLLKLLGIGAAPDRAYMLAWHSSGYEDPRLSYAAVAMCGIKEKNTKENGERVPGIILVVMAVVGNFVTLI
jgi:hypothetical protein